MLHGVVVPHHLLVPEVLFLLVARVSKLDEQRLRAGRQHLLVERVDDLLAHLAGLHATEADATRLPAVVAQYTRAHHRTERSCHVLKVRLIDVVWQIGNIQVGRVLLILKNMGGTHLKNLKRYDNERKGGQP